MAVVSGCLLKRTLKNRTRARRIASGRPPPDDRLARRNGSRRSSGDSAAALHPANPAQSREWTGTPSGNRRCFERSSKLSL
jgi:hypothetical protein